MPSATASGFPYPVGSDDMADTDLFIKALADFLEARAGNVPWRVVGALGQPTFQNSWVNYGSGYQSLAFRKVNDKVELRGAIKSGSLGAVFTLPVGYWPPATFGGVVPSNTGNALAYFEVSTIGVVSINSYGSGASNSYNSFDQVDFSVTV